MSRWDAFKATLRELFSPTPDERDPNYADLLKRDAEVRTEWVRKNRVEKGDEVS